ncbi:MAG: hypothetical protein LCH90_16955 [Proteobacteria bacterium]|nr:hypothetical protein [Pseudomonadota bacterium]
MILSCRSALYQNAPIGLQEQLLSVQASLRRLVTGRRALHRVAGEISASQWLPREAWEAWQLDRMRQLALHVGHDGFDLMPHATALGLAVMHRARQTV